MISDVAASSSKLDLASKAIAPTVNTHGNMQEL